MRVLPTRTACDLLHQTSSPWVSHGSEYRNQGLRAPLRRRDAQAASLAAARPTTIEQSDVLFKPIAGGWKLRLLSPTRGELIFYERTDRELFA
jgi:hypothetical protein